MMIKWLPLTPTRRGMASQPFDIEIYYPDAFDLAGNQYTEMAVNLVSDSMVLPWPIRSCRNGSVVL